MGLPLYVRNRGLLRTSRARNDTAPEKRLRIG